MMSVNQLREQYQQSLSIALEELQQAIENETAIHLDDEGFSSINWDLREWISDAQSSWLRLKEAEMKLATQTHQEQKP